MTLPAPQLLPEHFDPVVRSIPELTELRRIGPRAATFTAAVEAVPTTPTNHLLMRVGTTDDSLMLWELHLELDRREIPPALRQPERASTPQMAYVTWLADILWLSMRNPDHKPTYSKWSGLFKHSPASLPWHRSARWVYGMAHGKSHYYFSKGIGLQDRQLLPLMTLMNNRTRSDRGLLKRENDWRDRLYVYSLAHRDRSGMRSVDAARHVA